MYVARPQWPAVDHEVVAASKRHLRTFELDPTTLHSDILCHLAMEMFVSAGLPAGVGAESVRRFIFSIHHNFYYVFDVMQTTNAFATSTRTMARLDAWERFAVLSAARRGARAAPIPCRSCCRGCGGGWGSEERGRILRSGSGGGE